MAAGSQRAGGERETEHRNLSVKVGFIWARVKAWAKDSLGGPLSKSALGMGLSLFAPLLLKGSKG